MEEFSKDGRKLRPRKVVERHSSESDGSFRRDGGNSGKPYFSQREGGAPQRAYTPRRDGDRPERPYRPRREEGAAGRPYQSRRTESGRSFGPGREEGENRERRSSGPGRNFGGRSFGPGRGSNSGRSYGPGRNDDGARNFKGRNAESDRSGSYEKKGFGRGASRGFGPGKYQKPGARAGKASFNRDSEEGINRMISRRPQVSEAASFNEASADTMKIQEEVRLNKFIANSGVCSRREADTLIQAGVVTVNGEVVTELGVKVNVFNDDIRFNGERLKGEEKVYIVMNKPVGYVTTASDPHADKTVMDLIKDCEYRVYPVGRLDKGTTGVLMFTNDGEIAERLTHPSYDKKKIYQVALDKPLSEEDKQKLLEGITLTDGLANADELEFIDEKDHRKLGIEIHSGKNRIVRRMFESLGYSVKALDRVYFAGLTKKGLKKGEWRYLNESEVNILKMGAYA